LPSLPGESLEITLIVPLSHEYYSDTVPLNMNQYTECTAIHHIDRIRVKKNFCGFRFP